MISELWFFLDMFLPSEYGQQRVAGRLAYYSQTQRHSNSFFRGETEKKKKRYNNRKQDRWCDHEPHSRFFIPCPLDWRRVETNSQWYHPRDDRLVTNAQSRLRSPTFFLHNDKICGPHENDKIDYWLNQLPHVSRFSQRLYRTTAGLKYKN